MGCQASQPLPLRHRGTSLHPGDDHRLRDAGKRILRLQRGRSAAKAADAGTDLKGYAGFLKPIHLFPDGSIQAGIPGVQADDGFSFPFALHHDLHHFLQRHDGAVVNQTARRRRLQQLRIHQGACINNNIRPFQQFLTPDCN